MEILESKYRCVCLEKLIGQAANISSAIFGLNHELMFKAPFELGGRIRRTEYGITLIINVIVSFFCRLLLLSDESNWVLVLVMYLSIWVFTLSQGAKRCHDYGETGWLQLIPFYPLYMIFKEGDIGPNKYGDDPKSDRITPQEKEGTLPNEFKESKTQEWEVLYRADSQEKAGARVRESEGEDEIAPSKSEESTITLEKYENDKKIAHEANILLSQQLKELKEEMHNSKTNQGGYLPKKPSRLPYYLLWSNLILLILLGYFTWDMYSFKNEPEKTQFDDAQKSRLIGLSNQKYFIIKTHTNDELPVLLRKTDTNYVGHVYSVKYGFIKLSGFDASGGLYLREYTDHNEVSGLYSFDKPISSYAKGKYKLMGRETLFKSTLRYVDSNAYYELLNRQLTRSGKSQSTREPYSLGFKAESDALNKANRTIRSCYYTNLSYNFNVLFELSYTLDSINYNYDERVNELLTIWIFDKSQNLLKRLDFNDNELSLYRSDYESCSEVVSKVTNVNPRKPCVDYNCGDIIIFDMDNDGLEDIGIKIRMDNASSEYACYSQAKAFERLEMDYVGYSGR